MSHLQARRPRGSHPHPRELIPVEFHRPLVTGSGGIRVVRELAIPEAPLATPMDGYHLIGRRSGQGGQPPRRGRPGRGDGGGSRGDQAWLRQTLRNPQTVGQAQAVAAMSFKDRQFFYFALSTGQRDALRTGRLHPPLLVSLAGHPFRRVETWNALMEQSWSPLQGRHDLQVIGGGLGMANVRDSRPEGIESMLPPGLRELDDLLQMMEGLMPDSAKGPSHRYSPEMMEVAGLFASEGGSVRYWDLDAEAVRVAQDQVQGRNMVMEALEGPTSFTDQRAIEIQFELGGLVGPTRGQRQTRQPAINAGLVAAKYDWMKEALHAQGVRMETIALEGEEATRVTLPEAVGMEVFREDLGLMRRPPTPERGDLVLVLDTLAYIPPNMGHLAMIHFANATRRGGVMAVAEVQNDGARVMKALGMKRLPTVHALQPGHSDVELFQRPARDVPFLTEMAGEADRIVRAAYAGIPG